MIEHDPKSVACSIAVLRPHELTISCRIGAFHSYNVGRYGSREEALKDFPRVKREQLAAHARQSKPQPKTRHE